MSKNVLIIEDEQSLAKALSLKLEKSGHKVEIAVNGEDGLKKADFAT